MFENLVASTAVRERPVRSSLLSVAFHVTVLATAIVATRVAAVAAPASPLMPESPYLHLAAPRAASLPAAAAVAALSASALPVAAITVPITVPVGLPRIETTATLGQLQRLLAMPDHDPITPRGPPLYRGPSDSLHGEGGVDQPVRWRSGPQPEYPAAMRAAGLEGVVALRMVVDTLGRVERGSVVVVRATHPAFEAAAVAAVVRSRFEPARLRGRAVRQLVQQSVRFALSEP